MSVAAKSLANALRGFRDEYRKGLLDEPNAEALKAQALLREAKSLLIESGFAELFIYEFIEHPDRWPTDTLRHSDLPMFDVIGNEYSIEETKQNIQSLEFKYEQCRYKIIVIETISYDYTKAHKAELLLNDARVLGLEWISDISDMTDPEKDFTVYTLISGEWMQKIGNYILDVGNSDVQRFSGRDQRSGWRARS